MNRWNSDRDGNLPPEPPNLETVLGAFVPRPARLDRDRLMFEAGRASVAVSNANRPMLARIPAESIWRGVAGIMTCSTLVLAWLWLASPPGATDSQSGSPSIAATTSAPPTPSRILPEPRLEPESEKRDFALPAGNQLAMRNLALARGVDALAEPDVAGRIDEGRVWMNVQSTRLRHDRRPDDRIRELLRGDTL